MKKAIVVSIAAGFATWIVLRSGLLEALRPSWGKRQRLGGTWNQWEGKGKQVVGQVASDHSLTAEGIVEEALGAVRRVIGKAVDSI